MDHEWIKKIPREQLEQMYFKVVEEREMCKQERRWIHQMMSNPSASGDEKQVAYWGRFRMRNKEPRADGLFHIYNSDIAKDTGLSDDKVGKVFKSFEERGIVKRKLEKKPDENTGQLKTFNWMALDQSVLDNPRAIDFGKNDKWGGKREKGKCQSCGSDKIAIETKKRCTCADCGAIQEDDWKLLRDQTGDDTEEEIF